jgi:metallo-beta-lactamase family protein
MKLTFLGGAATVTGSKFLLESAGERILVDCGLFQGYKHLRKKNREPLAVDPASIDTVILTHAHLDHSGWLPILVRDGFRGHILTTAGTRDLCSILLPDSGRIQEEDARLANRKGFSRHTPALPLYTEADAHRALEAFRAVPRESWMSIGKEWKYRLHRAGHIVGASIVEVRSGNSSVLFSGDLGREEDLLMKPPARGFDPGAVVVESTYGNRTHVEEDPLDGLASAIAHAAARRGSVLIPAFAVGRAQALLLAVSRLRKSGRIPDVPVFLDSPMARDVLEIYRRHRGELRLDAGEITAMCGEATIINDPAESKALAREEGPLVIISASGMATGGRVLHHLKRMAPEDRNVILFSGYQAGGTRGADLVGGARSVKIHGAWVPVAAEVRVLDSLSAHADAGETLSWLGSFTSVPARTFIVHGEPDAADSLRRKIQDELGWQAEVPELGDSAEWTAG